MCRRSVTAGCLVAVLAAAAGARAQRLLARADSNDSQQSAVDWDSIQPSTDISWVACGASGAFECARFAVPLDYARPDGSAQAVLALQRIPATDKANYKGAVLFNPGGPGESGTAFVSSFGASLAAVLGPSYDLLGFDARGTGASTPAARCFAPDAYAAWTADEVLALHPHDGSVPHALARDRVTAAKCAAGVLREAGRFMNTAVVATDMLGIITALGQDRLHYWGFSYGTVLGQYFAAMYPDRVGIMLLDGVIDAVEYNYKGPAAALRHAATTVQDGDVVLRRFFELCSQAGTAGCAISEPTADAVETRFTRTFDALRARPVRVSSSLTVTQDLVSNYIYAQAYTPLTGYAALAAVFAALETRNTTFLSAVELRAPLLASSPHEAPQAIACTDMPDLSHTPLSQMVSTVREANARSRWLGPSMHTRARLQCVPWRLRAARPFAGPLESHNHTGTMLFLSNALDPVTPLADARAVYPRFAGARLAVQNGTGHTATLSMAASGCTQRVVAALFRAGVLPPDGTVCQPDLLPLVGPVSA